MTDAIRQPAFCFPQPPRGGRRAHSEPVEKPVVQPVEEQKLEDPQAGLQPEPTIKFLSTLLSAAEPPEPKHPEEDLETQESRFLDKEDWGARRTSEEISRLQDACMRLQASLSSIQADNLALKEKLKNLPSSLYENLKEEGKAVPEGAQEPRPSRELSCSTWTGRPMASDEGECASPLLPATTQCPAGTP